MKENPGFFSRLGDVLGLTDYLEGAIVPSKKLHRALVEGLEHPFSSRDNAVALLNLALKLKDRLHTYDTVISGNFGGRNMAIFFERLINNSKEEGTVNTVDLDQLDYWRQILYLAGNKESFGNTLVCIQDLSPNLYRLEPPLEGLGIKFDIVGLVKDEAEYYIDSSRLTVGVRRRVVGRSISPRIYPALDYRISENSAIELADRISVVLGDQSLVSSQKLE